ncbi:IPT/TIG domain-containing protein [Granulicella paludicola]|uniref:IPT/TIG domain-containing protein n=1 Tax=Granulicella paludicola TaxID=474951 RepID=UPI0021E04AC6|nr:IPT/TIG domain-containing protein [Granulicella paludicola]
MVTGLATLVLLAGAAQTTMAQLTVPIGTTSAVQTATVEVSVSLSNTTGTTPATAFVVLTEGSPNQEFSYASGGTCPVSTVEDSGFICTIKYTFKPKYSGIRYGAVELISNGGAVMATTLISAIGTGPQTIFPQTTTNTLPGTYSRPKNLAIDGAGDIYVANFGGGNVLKIPVGCTTASCVTTVGGGFEGPASVALDGAGNIYVADYTASLVKEMAPDCAVATCALPLAGGFYKPTSVKVDANGLVYIADSGNNAIKEIPGGCTSSSCVLTIEYGFLDPQDIAVDANGIIYIVDYGHNAIKSTPANCISGCAITTLGGGFNGPSGVAVDANGNVYVGDSGNSEVKVMTPNCTPADASTCVTTISSAFSNPIGVTLDGSGNLYVADDGNTTISEILRATVPSVTFPNVYDGSTGTPQTVTLTNFGNEPLTISEPSSGVNPSVSSSFTLATGGTGACPSVSAGGSAATLLANASCTLTINFAPVLPESGTVAGSVVLTDNNANVSASTQTIALSGSATTTVPAITSISPTDGLPAGGTTVTLNGTFLGAVNAVKFGSAPASSFHLVSATQMTAVAPAEAVGVVDIQATNAQGESIKTAGDQFTYTNTLLNVITFPVLADASLGGAPPALTATATSGQPVTYTTNTPAVCTVAGTSITDLKLGTCTITASQSATGHYGAAASVPQSFQVVLVENVGTSSPTLTATLTFTTAVSAGAALTTSVTTMGASGLDYNLATGGSCVSGKAYAVGATCTVNYTFKPLYPGIRSGGIALSTGSGTSAAIVASAYIAGQGMGPQIIYPASSPTQIYGSQQGFAMDGAGTLYLPSSNGTNAYYITVIPAGCLGSGCQSQISLPSLQPTALAVDGIGNIYVLSSTDVVVLPPGCRGSCASTRATVTGGTGLAVDMSGNIYVPGTKGLTEIPVDCLSSSCYENLGGGVGSLSTYQTMTIDFAGNVYFVVPGTPVVDMLSPDCLSASCVTALGGGSFASAMGVAVDPNGNVYIADYGTGSIDIMPPNCFSSSCVQSIFQITSQFGISLDEQGNMYVSSDGFTTGGVAGIFELTRSSPPTLSFEFQENDGSSSQPLTTSITNYGTQPLIFSVPSSGVNPSASTNFGLQVGDSGECPVLTSSSTTASLASGATCNLPIIFAPVVPADGTTTGTLTLTNNNLNAVSATQAINLTGYAYGPPTVTKVSPASGSAGTTVTITGTKFFTGATVSFGTTAATTVTVNGTTSITVTAPAHSSGTVDITVTYQGTSTTTPADQFTYLPPTVTAISPTSGSAAGGTTVTITGTKFASGATVSFGGAAASSVTYVSATRVTAVSPPGDIGVVDITVTTAAGTSPVVTADKFTYTAIASTITFPALADTVISATPPVLAAASNSPAAITYTSTTTSVCTVASGVITDVAGGTCSITASQAASGNYAAATQVSQSYAVLVPLVFVAGSGKIESFANNGSLTSPGTAYGGVGAAVDSSGHMWSIVNTGTSISRFSSLGAGVNEYNNVGLVGASALAIDGNSQIWVTNSSGKFTLLSNAGAVASVAQGSTTAAPSSIAIDLSGDVWIANPTTNTVDEIIGGAGPAAPLSTAVTSGTPGARP